MSVVGWPVILARPTFPLVIALMSSSICSIFVYGTLMRGQQRAPLWPRPAVQIVPAQVRGALYDLGPYPGLIRGEDWVAGELWEFEPEDMPETLQVLDAIECFGQGGVDLYERDTTSCRLEGGERTRDAWLYRYAETGRLLRAMRVTAGTDGLCRWRTPVGDLASQRDRPS